MKNSKKNLQQLTERDLLALDAELKSTLGSRATYTLTANSKSVKISARPAFGESNIEIAADIDRLVNEFAARRFFTGVLFDVRMT